MVEIELNVKTTSGSEKDQLALYNCRCPDKTEIEVDRIYIMYSLKYP
jgi:hypothetical protein